MKILIFDIDKDLIQFKEGDVLLFNIASVVEDELSNENFTSPPSETQ